VTQPQATGCRQVALSDRQLIAPSHRIDDRRGSASRIPPSNGQASDTAGQLPALAGHARKPARPTVSSLRRLSVSSRGAEDLGRADV
jgi:hypothetical protein